MPKQKGFSSLIIVIIVFLIILFLFAFTIKGDFPVSLNKNLFNNSTKNFLKQNTNTQKDTKIKVDYEKIPGSKFHSPDGTWWGYNQNKIARHADMVFMYVIENTDNSNKTPSKFVIYAKKENESWVKGASFPTSRPGNILVDSQGILHAFVFEPFDINKNDSWGKLKHYYFPETIKGNVQTFKEEIIIDNDGTSETANIRVGSAIDSHDTLVVSFGLTKFNPLYKGQSEHVYRKKAQDSAWQHLVAGENLNNDWYYPFTLVNNENIYLLPIQDDYNGADKYNTYQKIAYFEYSNNNWKQEIIADLTGHPLAETRTRLLEQSEFFFDSKEQIHIIYKETLDPKSEWKVTNFKHLIKTDNGWITEEINQENKDLNWIRMFEVDSKLYYLASSWDRVYVKKIDGNSFTKLDIGNEVKAIYPYISTQNNGSKNGEKYLDILLLTGESKDYSKHSNYYLKILKSEFSRLN